VVVGAGPVGYVAALGLARQGVPVVLLEADDGVCVGSRAICVSRRSLEIAERLGALPGFLKVGLPWTGGRSFYRQQQVLHFQMPADENQKLPPMLNMAQYSIEQALLDEAQALGGLIDIRWQTRLVALKAQADGVTLSLDTPLGPYTLEADWLVAADGGRSRVREALGLALEGTTYEGRYVIVDIRMHSARCAERLAYFDPPCNPGSTVLVHKQPHDVWRIDYQLREGEDPDAAIQPDNVLPRVESLLHMMGETAPWQPIWTGLYKANALTLPQYRHGHVLLAGDAAHLLPIFGVRGANSGIDDADNLAWKLAARIQGWGSEALLNSYSHERVGAAHINLAAARKSTEFMAPPSFAFELMRTAVLGLAARHPALASLINPRQTSAITYTDSPLNAATTQPCTTGPAAGAALFECPLQWCDGRTTTPTHLTTLLHQPRRPGFTAFYFADTPTPPPPAAVALGERLAARAIGYQTLCLAAQRGTGAHPAFAWDDTGRLFPLYGAQPGHLMLVRPDGHVLGRWQHPDAATLWAALQPLLA
jgi:3-(3-hydroxy-phenyl)propionate hydroxylase